MMNMKYVINTDIIKVVTAIESEKDIWLIEILRITIRLFM